MADSHEQRGSVKFTGPLLFAMADQPLAISHQLLALPNQLRQTALLPRGGIRMNETLAPGAIENLDGLGIRIRDLTGGRGANFLDRRPQLAALRAIERGVSLGLTHALLGRLDSRHDDLGFR